jgi:hypothetical protein
MYGVQPVSQVYANELNAGPQFDCSLMQTVESTNLPTTSPTPMLTRLPTVEPTVFGSVTTWTPSNLESRPYLLALGEENLVMLAQHNVNCSDPNIKDPSNGIQHHTSNGGTGVLTRFQHEQSGTIGEGVNKIRIGYGCKAPPWSQASQHAQSCTLKTTKWTRCLTVPTTSLPSAVFDFDRAPDTTLYNILDADGSQRYKVSTDGAEAGWAFLDSFYAFDSQEEGTVRVNILDAQDPHRYKLSTRWCRSGMDPSGQLLRVYFRICTRADYHIVQHSRSSVSAPLQDIDRWCRSGMGFCIKFLGLQIVPH